MTNVVEFTGVTRLKLDPDRVLENTKNKLEGFVIAGYTKDGEEWFASTFADGGDALWLIKRFEKALLEVPDAD